MKEVCAIENSNGGVSVIHPNSNRYTTDPGRVVWLWSGRIYFRTLVRDIQEFFIWEMTKDPNVLGKRFGYHDHWYCPGRKAELESAFRLARDKVYLIMDSADLPRRNIRRNAWRFNSSFQGLLDDRRVTTEIEVMLALKWEQSRLVASGDLSSPLKRKIAWSRFDLMKPGEADPIVYDWRFIGDAPDCSRFDPPRDREAVPVPAEFMRWATGGTYLW